MQTSNLAFQLAMEWRYWQGQRLKLLFIMACFALLCALLTLILQLGHQLFVAPPTWSKPTDYLYTLARQHTDGRLAPLHRQAIDTAAETPGVQAAAWFSLQSTHLQLAAEPEQPLQALFYSDSFATVLGISQLSPSETPGVWLSERFWREQLQSTPDAIGQLVSHPRFPIALPIAGVLPASLNRIGPFQPDLWLSDHWYRYLTPFAADSGLMLDRFLQAAPLYYGILAATTPLSPQALTEHLQQQDLTVPGMTMGGDGSELIVHAGLNLDPPARLKLLQQWQLGLVLLLGFGLVLSFNTFTVFTSRLIQQQEHYRIQQILGASMLQLLRGPLLVAAMLIAATALFSALLSLGLLQLLHSDQLQSVVGEAGLSLDWQRWFAALALVANLLLGCTCLPVLRLSRQALFSRQTGQSRSRGQKWLAQLNLTAQLWVALVALAFMLGLSWQQWQQFRSYPLDTGLMALPVQQQATGFDFSALVQDNVPQVQAAEVAFEVGSFDSQSSNELKDDRLAAPIAIQQRIVSGNYFSRLQIPILQGENDWQHGVVINQTLARLLQAGSETPLLGSELNLGSFAGRHPIVAIVADIPHQGFSQSAQPAAYLHHQSAAMLVQFNRTLELYFPAEHQARLKPALTGWLEQQLATPQFLPVKSLAELLQQQDRESRQLLKFSSGMILLVLITVFFSLYYQVRNRILLERQEYGVLLALGADDWRLLARATSQPLLGLLITLPLALAALAWLLHSSGWLSAFALQFNPVIFVFAAVLLLLMAWMAALAPIIGLLKKPIFGLLRTH
ncbi:FtsX-like permease family protein [Alkalimonas sp. MEB108]|uniref:FtsX-like permease family protein n=1 Tax=Alkalimonas cellulosilytica TaxID=3058395 RepID=A0ABU7J7D6_9GAMM|nr:FtsX-like permease family protein [Alkalimonas sp. MEB108]MEE2002175.1 FtsX-like permease family protein [Alkalimonas sp. MEB108]